MAVGLAALAIVLGCGGLLPAEPETDPPPEAPQPLPEGLLALEDRLEPIRAHHRLPALGGAVVEGDALIAIGAVGVRRAGSSEPVTSSDRWHIGSLTKSMTALLAARQVQAGRLRYDQTVAELLADHSPHPGWAEVTVTHLLQHQGGSPDPGLYQMFTWFTTEDLDPVDSRQQWVASTALATAPAPGSFAYSNGGYMILGEILAAVDGRPWETQIREDLFTPLGMQRSDLGPPPGWHQPWGHRRLGWLVQGGEGGWAPIAPGPGADNPSALGPAGVVHASLPDLARYAAAHLAIARGDLPWDHPAYTALHTAVDGGTYAGGWVIRQREEQAVLWHNGSNTLWHAQIELQPERNRALLVVLNAHDPAAAAAALDALAALPDPSP